ncbi:hypothetical protein GCM10017784_35080 [Deinococcus indicus]|uniref:hypothetical protein n=1 Tax=Deinococcus indicus TaxID=223556 RepID=UPI0017485E65|nr:hypothetical protein [Deinococcus indicus]GHG37635.1 hypothetical protein GCM10017784_35080 [Deinococcus indicus]
MTATTPTVHLTRSEINAFTITLGQQRYLVRDGQTLAIAPTGRRGTRYTDADDRPGDLTPDGNGWTHRTEEYATEALAPERAAQVELEFELARLAREFAPGYLDALPRTERRERLLAELEAARSAVGPRRTRRAVKLDGQWTTEPIPADPVDDDRL